MKTLLIIIAGLALSWHFTDLESDSVLTGMIAPLGLVVFLISLLLWLVMFLHNRGISQTTSHHGDAGGFGGFGDGGGDS